MNTTLIRTSVLASAALLLATVAEAAPLPVQVSLNGAPVGVVSWTPDPAPGAFVTAQTTFLNTINIGESLLEPTSNPAGAGWSFSYGLGFNVPANTLASTLKVVYDIPFGPNYLPSPAQPLLVTSTLIGTLLDGTGTGVQIITPSSGFVQTVTFQPGIGNNVGVSVGPNAFGAATGNTGQQFAYGEFSASGSLTSGSYGAMTVVAEFTLEPGTGAFAFDGTVTVTPVPEPEGWALILAGLGLVGTIVRRRKG